MRAGLEKAKQALEKESADLGADLRSLASSKQDVEHKKKKLEGQLSELHSRFSESERQKMELSERISKMAVSRLAVALVAATSCFLSEESCGDGDACPFPPSLPGGAGRRDESAERSGREEHQAEQGRVRSELAAPGCPGEAGEQVTN